MGWWLLSIQDGALRNMICLKSRNECACGGSEALDADCQKAAIGGPEFLYHLLDHMLPRKGNSSHAPKIRAFEKGYHPYLQEQDAHIQ